MTELAFLGNVGMVSDCLLCSFHSLYFGFFFLDVGIWGKASKHNTCIGIGHWRRAF